MLNLNILRLVTLIPILCAAFVLFGKEAMASELKSFPEEWLFPAEGTISDVFEARGGAHKGIDIAGSAGDPVFAAEKGIVVKSYVSSTYGQVVFLRHSSGYETVYAHMQKRFVQEGQSVEGGEKIGLIGSTGHSSGPHLHFEVHRGNWTPEKENAIDPFLIFGKAGIGESVAAHATAIHEQTHPVSIQAVDSTSLAANAEDHIYDELLWSDLYSDGENMETVGDPARDRSSQHLPAAPEHHIHVVSQGDTLWKIAGEYEVTVEDIMLENSLSAELLPVGMKLEIPAKQLNVHLVKQGETLTSIASQWNTSIEKIAEWNHLPDLHELQVSQKLIIKRE